jgi:hypothetical protein
LGFDRWQTPQEETTYASITTRVNWDIARYREMKNGQIHGLRTLVSPAKQDLLELKHGFSIFEAYINEYIGSLKVSKMDNPIFRIKPWARSSII